MTKPFPAEAENSKLQPYREKYGLKCSWQLCYRIASELLNLAISILPFENKEFFEPENRGQISRDEKKQLYILCEQYEIEPDKSDTEKQKLLAEKLATDIDILNALDHADGQLLPEQFWKGTSKKFNLALHLWMEKLASLRITTTGRQKRAVRALGIVEIIWHIQYHFDIKDTFDACMFLERTGLPRLLRKPTTGIEEKIYQHLKSLWDTDFSKANIWRVYKEEAKFKKQPAWIYLMNVDRPGLCFIGPSAYYEVEGLKTRNELSLRELRHINAA